MLRAEGRETRGQGNASATITAMLAETASGGHEGLCRHGPGYHRQGRPVRARRARRCLRQAARAVRIELGDDRVDTGRRGLARRAPGQDRGWEARGSGDSTGDGSEPETAPAPAPSRPRRTRKAAAPKPPENDQGAEPAAAAATAEPAAATAEPATDETAGSAPADEPAASTATPRTPDEGGVRRIDHPEAQPVDLVDVAGPSLRRRILPYASIAGGIFLLRIVIYALRRRKK